MTAPPQSPFNLPGYRTIAGTATDDCPVGLHRRDHAYVITSCRRILMSNEDTRSERALGRLTARLIRHVPRPRVLVGGLGMGFTLRALLDSLPRAAQVTVAELLPAVVRWNARLLGHLASHPLHDRRVRLHIRDVAKLIPGRPFWHAIILDVDNGPDWLVQRGNGALYSRRGLDRIIRSVHPGGALVVWSAERHRPFERRLRSMHLRSRRYSDGLGAEPSQAVLYEIRPRSASG